jgi:hypothetical protein
MQGKEQIDLPLLQVIPLLFSWLKPLVLTLWLIMDGMNHHGSPSAVLSPHHRQKRGVIRHGYPARRITLLIRRERLACSS